MKSFKLFAALLALALLVFLGVKFFHNAPPADGVPANLTQNAVATPAATPPVSVNTPAAPKPAPPSAVVARTEAPRLKAFPALAEFSDWANRFARGENVDLAVGERLALNRRNVMSHLIKTDPEAALAQAVPARWRRDLPAEVTRYFEQRVDARGSLTVMIATDFEQNTVKVSREVEVGNQRYDAFPYGWRRSQMSQTSIPIHGIAIDNKLALDANPIRVLEPEEAQAAGVNPSEEICGVSGNPADSRKQPVAADTGGRVRQFCGIDHFKLVNEGWIAAEGGPGGRGGPVGQRDLWTQGTKNLLYMRVNFPDDLSEPISEAGAYSAMSGVNSYYVEGSYNTISLITTVTPLMTLPQTKSYYSAAGAGALLSDARQVARDFGFETANFDRDIVAHTSVPGFDWGGLASVGGKGVWLQSTGVGVTAHELGHNQGLWHANWWDTIGNEGVVGTGTHIEYGNVYDTMGSASAGANQFNAMHKWRIDWLPESYIHNVTSNGVYRLFAFDVPNRTPGHFFAAKFRRDWQRDYWLELRQKFPSNPWLVHGVSVNWSPWQESSGGTHLLDTTPGTPTSQSGREDAAVVIGRTFSDPPAGVHITPVARGGTGITTWMDVTVNVGAFPSNRPPTLQIFADQTNSVVGTRINFRADSTDPDGDTLAYYWDFGDLTFSLSNAPVAFKTWTASGEHVVRCVASDMKGGSASANVVVRVGTPPANEYRVGGRITDTNGVPIEGVRVHNGETNANTYLGGYTDTNGYYVIVGVPDGTSFTAARYGYTFSPNSATVSLPPDVTTNDFIATALTTVNIAATTNTVSEPNGTADFVITRSDTNADLEVTLYRSGRATISSDYTLSPWQNGTNFFSITIPAGTNSIPITLQVTDDGSSEGPETVTLTLAEDTNVVSYIVTSLGEATVTILDNDTIAVPSVSVSSTSSPSDNSAPENGFDNGRFVFTRAGSVANDLTVNYSVSGSATAGVDYQALLGVVIIPAGQSTASVELQTIDDTQVETNETVIVTVSPNPAYNASGSSATARIIDDDLVMVTISPTSGGAAEPTTTGRFTVTRVGDLVPNLVVNYTVGGSATSGTDYAPLSGTVTIPAGATTATITVTPVDDALVEGDESVIVSFAANPGYNVGTPGSATIFIRDNERPTVSVSTGDSEASEPGSDTAMFTVSRGSVTSGNLTVELAITGTALAGYDYIPLDNPVIIPDGSSSVDLVVTPFDDLHREETEQVIITIATNANYVFSSGARASIDILDDDNNAVPAVGFALAASSAPESRSGVVAVSLSRTSSAPVTVDFTVYGGTATAGADYALPAGTLTIDPGVLAVGLPLTINNDSTVEPNETIKIVLTNPNGATHDGIKFHTYTILDDDSSTVTISATAATATEAGPVPGNFRLSRTGSTTNNLAVWVQTTGTASAPSDYAPITNVVTIPAGASFVDIPVMPVEDNTVEIAETVVATVTSAPGAKIGSSAQATVTIVDNDIDDLPVITVVSSNSFAAEPGTDTGEFTFTRTGATNAALTIFFTLAGTANSSVDYSFITNVVIIPAGQTSAVVTLTPLDDAIVEGEETAILDVTARDTYRVGAPSEATVTILDNEQRVRVEVSDAYAAEPGSETGEFTFIRFGTTNGDLTVFFTVSGTAGNGVDYLTITNSIVIPANETEARLVVTPLDDYLIEPTETVVATLSSNPAYILGTPTAGTVMLYDNEPTFTLVGTATNASENGLQPGIITINRGGDPLVNVEVHISIGGTATFGVDYPAFRTNICMPAGVMTTAITFYPTNELLLEGDETVFAALVPDPDYTILSPSNTTVTIADVSTNHFPVAYITSPTAKTIYSQGSTNLNVILEATAADPDDTNAVLTFTWSQVSGPGTMFFGDPATNSATTVSFTNKGVYLVRVGADDGQLIGFDYLTVVVDSTNVFTPDLLHWRFDEGSGTNALDSSGLGRDGLVSGASWITNGPVDGALSFDGGSNVVAEISGTNFLNGLDALTVTFWAKTSVTNDELGVFTADVSDSTNNTLAFGQVLFSSCLGNSNLLKATLPTTGGDLRYVSSRRFASNEWQHFVLVWTNGSPLALYINGEPDSAVANSTAVTGVLTNCSQFLIGRDKSTNYWNGAVDDVRLFARAFDAGEVKALLSLPPTNFVPFVDAGADMTVQLINPVNLAGEIVDDGLPDPPAMFTNVWTFFSGPGTPTIVDPTNLISGITFTNAGSNVFRLIADDSVAKVFDDVVVTVTEPTVVDVFASDGDAAELGPDTAQFMISRSGDTNYDISVQLIISGIASNGADYVTITNVYLVPASSNFLSVTITPFLDDRTEGDETVTLTIVPALAYTIGNPSATATIHDSPYGVWSVAHFTLEELTDPTLSGEGVDFDHDGLGNFAEYAFDGDPKAAETNSPMAVTIELNPADSQNHITLTYHRRVQPVDVNYAVYISNDLFVWNTGPTYVEEISATPDANGFTETVKARIVAPYTLTTNQFLTIRVWRPPQP